MEQTLHGKTILMTGGTSRLGRAFSSKALARGARLFFTYHKNAAAAENLIQSGAVGFPLDLSDTKAIEDFAKAFKEKAWHLDVLIHNAAAVRDHTIQNLTEEEWDYVLNVDLKAPFYLTKKLLPLLIDRKKSKPRSVGAIHELPLQAVVNGKAASKVFMLTSRAAICGGIGISNYAAAKAGVIALTKSLAQEWGRKKILFNVVNPGFMQSAMTANLPEQVLENNREASPLEEFSNPEEVADFLIYLCSDAMTQVTGQVFHFESRKI